MRRGEQGSQSACAAGGCWEVCCAEGCLVCGRVRHGEGGGTRDNRGAGRQAGGRQAWPVRRGREGRRGVLAWWVAAIPVARGHRKVLDTALFLQVAVQHEQPHPVSQYPRTSNTVQLCVSEDQCRLQGILPPAASVAGQLDPALGAAPPAQGAMHHGRDHHSPAQEHTGKIQSISKVKTTEIHHLLVADCCPRHLKALSFEV